MGNFSSQEHKLPAYNWTLIQKGRLLNYQSRTIVTEKDIKQQNLYKNQNNQYAEKYNIARQYTSLEEEMEIYYYRFATKRPLVKVYEVKPEKGKGFCSNQTHLHVYQEYIPYRLCDIRNLPHDSGLCVLSQALYGFQELFAKVGSFPVDQHFIGFNREGKTKVWYNQNFASNRKTLDGIILMGLNSNNSNLDKKMTQSQQFDMVQDVWLAIDKFALFNEQFRHQSGGFVDCDFNRARSIVQNQIRRRSNVPDRIRFGPSIVSKQSELNQPALQRANQQHNLSNLGNYNISPSNFQVQQVQDKSNPNNKIEGQGNIKKKFGTGHNTSYNNKVPEAYQNNGNYYGNQNNLSNLYPQKYSTKYY